MIYYIILIVTWFCVLSILLAETIKRRMNFFTGVAVVITSVITVLAAYCLLCNPLFFNITIIMFIVTVFVLSFGGSFSFVRRGDRWLRYRGPFSEFVLLLIGWYTAIQFYNLAINMDIVIVHQTFLQSYGVNSWLDHLLQNQESVLSLSGGWYLAVATGFCPFLMTIGGISLIMRQRYYGNERLGKSSFVFCLSSMGILIFFTSFFLPLLWPFMAVTHLCGVLSGIVYSRLTWKVKVLSTHPYPPAFKQKRKSISGVVGVSIPRRVGGTMAELRHMGWKETIMGYSGYFLIPNGRVGGLLKKQGSDWRMVVEKPPREIFEGEHKYCFRANGEDTYWVHFKNAPDDPVLLIREVQNYFNKVTRMGAVK